MSEDEFNDHLLIVVTPHNAALLLAELDALKPDPKRYYELDTIRLAAQEYLGKGYHTC